MSEPTIEPADSSEIVAADADFEAGWTPPAPSGVPAVDDAVADLAQLDQLPTGEHVAVYDAVHRLLQDALADIDGA